jgi:hypothetical protein
MENPRANTTDVAGESGGADENKGDPCAEGEGEGEGEGAEPYRPCVLEDRAEWSVRWVFLHLIEETARHADVIRGSPDGATALDHRWHSPR